MIDLVGQSLYLSIFISYRSDLWNGKKQSAETVSG